MQLLQLLLLLLLLLCCCANNTAADAAMITIALARLITAHAPTRTAIALQRCDQCRSRGLPLRSPLRPIAVAAAHRG
jgi:hypothetical protein